MADHISDAFKYLWERLHLMEPRSQLGGIYAFKPGYHSTRADNQANWPGNYSVVDAEDKGGPSDKAAAIDWTFPDAQAGNYDTIQKYSARLLASGRDPDDPRLNGWREFYGQTDADTHVEGYDFRYGHTVTSDPSHLWHIHLSCDRDKVNSRENMDNLLSVLRGESVALTSDDARKVSRTDGAVDNDMPWRTDSPLHKPAGTNETVQLQTAVLEAAQRANLALEGVKRIEAILAAGVPVPGLVNLTPEAIGAVAGAVVDELSDRLTA